MSKVLYSIYRYIVLGLFLVINIWLFLLSIFSTSKMTTDASEYTYYTGDYVWVHLIVLACIAVLTYILVKKKLFTILNRYLTDNDNAFRKVRNICLIIIGITGAVWVILTQSHAGADQYYVLDAAAGLRSHDYTMFMRDGYIAKYTNQIGLLFIEYIIGFVVDDYNYIFWQLLNVIMIVFTYKMLADLFSIWKLPRLASVLFLVLGILFFPWTLYSVFIYGNIAGLFFAVMAFKYTMLFVGSSNTYNSIHISYIAVTGAAMMMSVMVKSNYLIFMIALILYTIAETLRHKNIQIILVTCAIAAGFAIQAVFPKLIIEKISGYNLDNGASSWTWIDMGLHSTTATVYADGWYNSRIASLYERNDYDSKKEAQAAKADIKGYINNYKSDPNAFTSFLSKKIASQWNNPGFQCFWITNVRNSSITQSGFITDILSLKGGIPFMNYLNILQSIILFGSMLYAVYALFFNSAPASTVLPLTFIGGFIFHIFWEGKCQYTLPYFVLLLPLSIIGFFYMAKVFIDFSKKNIYHCAAGLIVLILVTIIFNHFIIINHDNKSYKEYKDYTIKVESGEITETDN